jgi:hypothetical protein
MALRLRPVSILAAALVALTLGGGATQGAWASPAPEVGGTNASADTDAHGRLTITAITSDEYANSDEYLEGHCSTSVGVTICDKVLLDNSSLGEARWTAVAAVGHADDLYVDETVKTVEGNKLWSSGHASGLGPWVRLTWVSPKHLGDTDGITIPGEAKLQFLTTIAIPGSLGPTSYCAGPEQDLEYQLSCGTSVPDDWG